MQFFDNILNKATSLVSGTASDATAPIANTVPSVATDSGAQKTLGTAPEAPGTTMAGGRRVKTRRSRKGKKTHKRRQRKH
jgi:hypothetical protein